MAVEDFIPITDVKRTTEKEVKQKPTIAELTTIESPGKPVPASQLEYNRKTTKKTTTKRKKEKSEGISIREPKKDSILIITEKPQAAQKIASSLGNPSKYNENGVYYYEVEHNKEKIIVASAVGHLFGLTYQKGQKGWPIFEIMWRPSYEIKSVAYTKKYYDLLKKLSRKAKEIIVATDYDIEGEVIGWNIVRFICNKQTAKRMKYSTLTKPELQKSYENTMAEPDWGQAYAGETRHILDWLYGINLSRGLMSAIKTTGSFKVL
ncbi:MAG: toprim domain-containing protein, partial [Nanoarchaeota archaeon]|nr:toprim domain-containing protein [Nanoarchaeota archaeon]